MENSLTKRKHWTAKRKIEVVLEGLKEKETVGEELFRHGGRTKEAAEKDTRIAHLERKPGQLVLENSLLKKVETWRGIDGRMLNGSVQRAVV